MPSPERARAAAGPEPARASAGTEAASRAKRILVIDDEPSLVDAVATIIRYEGFEVDEAATGRFGIAGAVFTVVLPLAEPES